MNLFRQIPHNKPTAEAVINPRSQKASQEYIAPDFSIIYLTEMQKKMQELMAGVAVGDSVLTSSGFYGVIIDMTDDTVIVEFGSNKNCRIPMRKDAIVQVEKPEL